jgi:hypothetical protein
MDRLSFFPDSSLLRPATFARGYVVDFISSAHVIATSGLCPVTQVTTAHDCAHKCAQSGTTNGKDPG